MKVVDIPIIDVVLGPFRTRSHVHEHRLEDLIASFHQAGILQPIIVQVQPDGGYLLVAGERRYLAAKTLGLETIPAVLQSSDCSIRQTQLVENIQREDLNPVDRAEAVRSFMDEEDLNKTEAAKRLGVPRTTLTDWLAILQIPEKYQQAVLNNFYGGSSPLTGSHIALAKRFADKVASPNMFEIGLDAILYYGLTRAEAKKVFETVANRSDYSIEKAVKAVRLTPGQPGEPDEWQWDVDTLVTFLSRSGDYLVKTKQDNLTELDEEQRHELLRQSRALRKLLDEIVERVGEMPDVAEG